MFSGTDGSWKIENLVSTTVIFGSQGRLALICALLPQMTSEYEDTLVFCERLGLDHLRHLQKLPLVE